MQESDLRKAEGTPEGCMASRNESPLNQLHAEEDHRRFGQVREGKLAVILGQELGSAASSARATAGMSQAIARI